MGKSGRKFKRRNAPPVSSINFDAKCADIAEQAIYKVLSVAVDILWNNFGGLQKRNERLKFFRMRSVTNWSISTKDLLRSRRKL